jgi:hypothetical protein
LLERPRIWALRHAAVLAATVFLIPGILHAMAASNYRKRNTIGTCLIPLIVTLPTRSRSSQQ